MLILISISLLVSTSLSQFVHSLNSTIFVKVNVKTQDSNNITASIYDGRLYNEKTENTDPKMQNKSYLFEFDVKNVPEISEEEKEYSDEDEGAEFRVCAIVDKSKSKNYQEQPVCDNVIINDSKENVTIEVR